jgi:hypothetical protein
VNSGIFFFAFLVLRKYVLLEVGQFALSFFVIKRRQAIKRNMTTPFALQLRQFTDKFEPDLFMALAARREGLSPDQRYLMGQAMLRMNHAINSAFRDDGGAFKKLAHKRVHF